MNTRQQIIEAIREQEISVLIIGAGINGIGTFRDLAAEGLDVLIVDRGDFCSGASAASSHMLHGGIRYLENAEFRLVREALHERNLLIENAPHNAKPLRTTIPIFNWFSGLLNAPLKFLNLRDKPAERGALVIKIGLILYDWFIRHHRTMPSHTLRMKAASLKEYPYLNPNIVCTATYFDGFMPSPERLCIELILDTEVLSDKAYALNYMPVIGGNGDTLTLRDELSGDTVNIHPKVVINAAGPWIDFANQAMGLKTQFIGGTKGSHLVLNHPQLYEAVNNSEIFFENNDGRIVLLLPYVDGRVIAGTTDIRIDQPDEAVCTDEETEYMLGMVNKVFPTVNVDRSHIVFKFCGVRPLPGSKSSFTGQISRDHSIETMEASDILRFPVLSLVGGKWTTFRAFSEQVTNAVLKRLGKARRGSTMNMPIGGGKMYPRTDEARKEWLDIVSQRTGVARADVEKLFERYGTRAEAVSAFIACEPDSLLQHQANYSVREILFLIEQEKVIHLSDLVLRRSLLAWLGYLNQPLLEELVDIMAKPLNWSEATRQMEIKQTITTLRDKHGTQVKG